MIQAYRKTHGGTHRPRRWSSRSSPAPLVTSACRARAGRRSDRRPGGCRGGVDLAGRAAAAPAGIVEHRAVDRPAHPEGQPGTHQVRTGHGDQRGHRAADGRDVDAEVRHAGAVGRRRPVRRDHVLPTIAYPTTGAPWAYKKVTFSVPAGADELDGRQQVEQRAAFNGPGPVVRMSLFAPDGAFVANTRPQGGANPSNYGSRDGPAPGCRNLDGGPVHAGDRSDSRGTYWWTRSPTARLPVGTVPPSLHAAPGRHHDGHRQDAGARGRWRHRRHGVDGQLRRPSGRRCRSIVRALIAHVSGGRVHRHDHRRQRPCLRAGADALVLLRRAQGQAGPRRRGARSPTSPATCSRACSSTRTARSSRRTPTSSSTA